MKPFEARVTKDSLVFSAAHFITFNGNICERLHGHNWRLDVVVAGDLDENHYVFDFIALRDTTQRLVDQLDPGNVAYNMPFGMRLVGGLDIDALEQSLTELVRRHDPDVDLEAGRGQERGLGVTADDDVVALGVSQHR